MNVTSQVRDPAVTKILIIGDDLAIREVIDDYLASKGFITLQATDSKAGLTLIVSECPDLILLDLRLPGLEALELLNHIKRDTPQIPVIIVSGQGTVENASTALRMGAWDYITKPIFDLQVLDIAVHNVLERARGWQGKRGPGQNLIKERPKEKSDLELRCQELEKAYQKLNRTMEERSHTAGTLLYSDHN
jgi:putative two-component system response regulator